MPIHIVGSNDCITNLAEANGFFWETLWNHPDNQTLKDLRKDPNVLAEFDEVFIPDLTPKDEDGATEAKHRFRKKGVPALVRLCIKIDDEPIANTPCTLVVDGNSTDLTTDGDGFIEMPLPPGAQSGELRIKQPRSTTLFQLMFGRLDPIESEPGVVQRLKSLGFGLSSPEELDAAVGAFRKKHGMGEGGIDDSFRSKLESEFGQ